MGEKCPACCEETGKCRLSRMSNDVIRCLRLMTVVSSCGTQRLVKIDDARRSENLSLEEMPTMLREATIRQLELNDISRDGFEPDLFEKIKQMDAIIAAVKTHSKSIGMYNPPPRPGMRGYRKATKIYPAHCPAYNRRGGRCEYTKFAEQVNALQLEIQDEYGGILSVQQS